MKQVRELQTQLKFLKRSISRSGTIYLYNVNDSNCQIIMFYYFGSRHEDKAEFVPADFIAKKFIERQPPSSIIILLILLCNSNMLLRCLLVLVRFDFTHYRYPLR